MPLFRATNIIRTTGVIPENDIVSTLHFTHPDETPSTDDLTKLAKSVSSIWVDCKADLAARVVGTAGAHSCKISRIDGALAAGELNDVQTSPLLDYAYTISPVGGDSMPPEIAAVVSFKPNLEGVFEVFGASRPRQRRRGRFYFGPLRFGALGVDGMFTTIFRDALRDAVILHLDHAGEIAENRLAGSPWRWVTYSRAEGMNWQVKDVHVDNAPDIQRRRGLDSTARSTGALVGT